MEKDVPESQVNELCLHKGRQSLAYARIAVVGTLEHRNRATRAYQAPGCRGPGRATTDHDNVILLGQKTVSLPVMS